MKSPFLLNTLRVNTWLEKIDRNIVPVLIENNISVSYTNNKIKQKVPTFSRVILIKYCLHYGQKLFLYSINAHNQSYKKNAQKFIGSSYWISQQDNKRKITKQNTEIKRIMKKAMKSNTVKIAQRINKWNQGAKKYRKTINLRNPRRVYRN